MSVILVTCSLTVLLLAFHKYVLAPLSASPLSKIPKAHWSAGWFTAWINFKRWTGGAATKAISTAHQQYGPVVQLAPEEVSVNTPDALRTIYIGGFEKDTLYLYLTSYGQPNMVSMLDNKSHSARKRIVSGVYSKSHLQTSCDMEAISREVIYDRLLPQLNTVAQKDKDTNVFSILQGVAMDFISNFLFGLQHGTDFTRHSGDRDWWLSQFKKSKVNPPKERLGGEIESWCLKIVDAVRPHEQSLSLDGSEMSSQPVVWQRLRDGIKGTSSTDIGEDATKLSIASECLDHIIAGHETTGITLTYLMYEFSKRSAMQNRLRNELLALSPQIKYTTQSPKSPAREQRLPSPAALDKLPLLNSIIQETLRLYAAAPAQQARVTPHRPDGLTLEGYTNIPGGISVSANAYSLHRNPEVFPEPERWIPERWLDASAERQKEMKRWFWAFGSGSRMCLGKHFALQGIEPFTINIVG